MTTSVIMKRTIITYMSPILQKYLWHFYPLFHHWLVWPYLQRVNAKSIVISHYCQYYCHIRLNKTKSQLNKHCHTVCPSGVAETVMSVKNWSTCQTYNTNQCFLGGFLTHNCKMNCKLIVCCLVNARSYRLLGKWDNGILTPSQSFSKRFSLSVL